MRRVKAAFYGNFACPWSSETHHAASLEELGVDVVRLQEPKVPWQQIQAAAEKSNFFCWIKTHGWETPGIENVLNRMKALGIPVISYHLDAYRQIPDRWRKYQSDPYMQSLDHFFTVDDCLAQWLNENTDVKGHYLPPGVFGAECYISDQPSPHANELVFVGSRGYHKTYSMRPKLIDWLKSTYGPRFTHVGGDGDTGTIRGDNLNRVYANSKVVVGDSFICDPNYQGKYWSDRIPETLGRGGGPLLHPWVYGLDEQFTDGEHLVTYRHGDFDDLKTTIDYFLDDANTEEREQIRMAGHEHVKAHHTYAHRWQTILDTVFRERDGGHAHKRPVDAEVAGASRCTSAVGHR